MFRIVHILILISFFSCAHKPIKTKFEAMRISSPPSDLGDDLEKWSLIQALEDSITYLNSLNTVSYFQMGPHAISKENYIKTLKKILYFAQSTSDTSVFFEKIKNTFSFFEAYGNDSWGDVFITSYYEPILDGSTIPTTEYSQPLFEVPNDLISVSLWKFKKIKHGLPANMTLYGRIHENELVDPTTQKIKKHKTLVPYWDRREIDEESILEANQVPIICWVKPIDSFFLQIQGSGTVILEDESVVRVGYAAQNGHPYVPIGKFLLDDIPLEDMSLQTIEAHLNSLPLNEQQKIFSKNPSYVFFQRLNGPPLTSFGIEVIPGRTIATDGNFFPKGIVGLLHFQKPIFANSSDTFPSHYEPTWRFVFNHDSGGAIRGPGRVDLFYGKGPSAKQHAGIIKHPGRLYFIGPKAN